MRPVWSHGFDAIVVGSGINGLAAAILLSRAGLKVVVVEGAGSIGGCVRSGELTLPGYLHDIGAAVYPITVASPFFRSLRLSELGLSFIQPPAAVAHPFEDGSAAMLFPSIEQTADTLGPDARQYRQLMAPLLEHWETLLPNFLGTFRSFNSPLKLTGFALQALQPALSLAQRQFKGKLARGFFCGLGAHSVIPLERVPSAAFGLVLGLAGHAAGWPIPAGGSQKITQALQMCLEKQKVKFITGLTIRSLDELYQECAIFLDVTPRQYVAMAGRSLPDSYMAKLKRFHYGPGVFKMDWALSEPIPWKARACLTAGTVHVGGSMESIAFSESEVWQNRVAQNPFVILAQPSLFDSTRAPQGKHTAWAYCHVPNGFTGDMTECIENRIEQFAPGFREVILARHAFNTADLEKLNPNLVGGDITGGAQTFSQMFIRPALQWNPYATPQEQVYLCSASTPPGAGVHGMCGVHAAEEYLKASHHEIK